MTNSRNRTIQELVPGDVIEYKQYSATYKALVVHNNNGMIKIKRLDYVSDFKLIDYSWFNDTPFIYLGKVYPFWKRLLTFQWFKLYTPVFELEQEKIEEEEKKKVVKKKKNSRFNYINND